MVFEVPMAVTARRRLRAFAAGDLDAYAAMQANPCATGHRPHPMPWPFPLKPPRRDAICSLCVLTTLLGTEQRGGAAEILLQKDAEERRGRPDLPQNPWLRLGYHNRYGNFCCRFPADAANP